MTRACLHILGVMLFAASAAGTAARSHLASGTIYGTGQGESFLYDLLGNRTSYTDRQNRSGAYGTWSLAVWQAAQAEVERQQRGLLTAVGVEDGRRERGLQFRALRGQLRAVREVVGMRFSSGGGQLFDQIQCMAPHLLS
jgi:hypothetical protein